MTPSRLRVLLAVVVLIGGGTGFVPAAPPTDDELKATAVKLNELTDLEAAQDRLTELLKDKESAKRLVKIAAKILKDAKEKEAPFKYNAALVLAKIAQNVKDSEVAEAFYETCFENASKLMSGPKMLQSFEGLLDIYWQQKKYQSVEEVARKFLDTDAGKDAEEAKPFVLEKLVQAKARQGDHDEALRMAEGLVQLDKGGWYFLQLKAWVQRDAGKIEDAIGTYEEVVAKLEKAKGLKKETKENLKKNTLYVLTGLYVDLKKIDKAADILQKLIKDDPENPTFYNDLGFIWADNDIKIDESAKMIEKAIDLDAKLRKKLLDDGKIDAETAKQENAAYLDSLGWVYFKQKKYDDALKYLEKASKDPEEGIHIEIWDHLADCLYALGRKKEAVETWTKGLKFDDVSPRDKERRKKVTEKLKKVKAELAKG